MNKKHLTEQEIRTRYITPAIRGVGWPLNQIREELYLSSLRTEAHRRQSRGAAGPVRRAGGGGRGGGGGSRAAAAGGAERGVDGVGHASVDLSPLFYGTCHMAQL